MIEKNILPEQKLAVLRAKQLIGIFDPIEYEKTRQEVISSLEPNLKDFWLFLEKTYDCEVCELSKDKGIEIIGYKIRTPKGTYLDYNTKKEIIVFMEKLNIKIDLQKRIETFFIISSLNNGDILSSEANKYGIKSIQEWDKKMDDDIKFFKQNRKEVFDILPKLENQWIECCKMMRIILSQDFLG
jgi:hypothetical protein